MSVRTIMKLTIKVLLYSGLVFPGAGYYILDKNRRGIISTAITIGCLLVIMKEVFQRATIVAEKLVQGGLAYDISTIREQILSTPGAMSDGAMSTLSMAIALVWFIALLDGYFIAYRMEASQG